jgi:hypothetical protein
MYSNAIKGKDYAKKCPPIAAVSIAVVMEESRLTLLLLRMSLPVMTCHSSGLASLGSRPRRTCFEALFHHVLCRVAPSKESI